MGPVVGEPTVLPLRRAPEGSASAPGAAKLQRPGESILDPAKTAGL
jgi:hypothetical protein